jgi:hypothetical protein
MSGVDVMITIFCDFWQISLLQAELRRRWSQWRSSSRNGPPVQVHGYHRYICNFVCFNCHKDLSFFKFSNFHEIKIPQIKKINSCHNLKVNVLWQRFFFSSTYDIFYSIDHVASDLNLLVKYLLLCFSKLPVSISYVHTYVCLHVR